MLTYIISHQVILSGSIWVCSVRVPVCCPTSISECSLKLFPCWICTINMCRRRGYVAWLDGIVLAWNFIGVDLTVESFVY